MIKIDMKKIIFVMLVSVFLVSTNALALETTSTKTVQENEEDNTLVENNIFEPLFIQEDDLDPNADLKVTVTIKEVRAFDKIDLFSNPDFYVKIFVNDAEYVSSVQSNIKYLREPEWSAEFDVPDDIEFVNVTIQLWDSNPLIDRICDISQNYANTPRSSDTDVTLYYSLKTGHWTGEDGVDSDLSGYGRLNGCDDNTIYQKDRDCEIWFDISQNDYDGDGIPYWTEVEVYETDPMVDDTGRDDDGDGVPIEWEHKWGHYFSWDWHSQTYIHRWQYNPFEWEDHKNLDLDEDGLDNVEEYLTSQWGSDPFRKDIFLEIDQMEIGPNGEGALIPDLAKELLIDAFSKHNIVMHIDDGCMGGGEMVPFDETLTDQDRQNYYFQYFLNNNASYWRRGAFHYALINYLTDRHPGFVFGSTADGENYSLDSLSVSTKYHETLPLKNPIYDTFLRRTLNKEYQRAMVYASAIMHETGHTLGMFQGSPPGCDVASTFPFDPYWFKFRNYKSCMNYGKIYYVVDYSDGTHGKNDHDDWNYIDLTLFQETHHWH